MAQQAPEQKARPTITAYIMLLLLMMLPFKLLTD
jgi:hypothetical protein